MAPIYRLSIVLLMFNSIAAMQDPDPKKSISSSPDSSNHFAFYDDISDQKKAREEKAELPRELYQQIVENLPISCVDIFVYDPQTESYFIVKRHNKPAAGLLWVLGGRQIIFESFFQAAIRKCADEMHLQVLPIAALGHYSTTFIDSEWGSPTHTNNRVVLAIVEPGSSPSPDRNHSNERWVSLYRSPLDTEFEVRPENLYLFHLWQDALAAISQHRDLIDRISNNQEELKHYKEQLTQTNSYQATGHRYRELFDNFNTYSTTNNGETLANTLWATIHSFDETERTSALQRLQELMDETTRHSAKTKATAVVDQLWRVLQKLNQEEQAAAHIRLDSFVQAMIKSKATSLVVETIAPSPTAHNATAGSFQRPPIVTYGDIYAHFLDEELEETFFF